jgi:hypothetical protein
MAEFKWLFAYIGQPRFGANAWCICQMIVPVLFALPRRVQEFTWDQLARQVQRDLL